MGAATGEATEFTQKEKDYMIHMARVMGDLYNEKQVIDWILQKMNLQRNLQRNLQKRNTENDKT